MGYYGKNNYFNNIGKMTNRGFEISALWSDQRRDWGYSVNAAVSFNRNTIDYMAEVAPAYDYNAETGRPYGTLIGLVADGFYDVSDFNDDGSLRDGLPQPMFGSVQPGDIRYLDLDNSGYVDQNDVTKIGKSPYPEWTYSVGAMFRYKGFDFSFLLDGIAGLRTICSTIRCRRWRSWTTAMFTRWRVVHGPIIPNKGIDTRRTATYPRLTTQSNENNYRLSSFWVKDRDFLRVRNIELGYRLQGPSQVPRGGHRRVQDLSERNQPLHDQQAMSDYDLDPELLSYRYPVLKSYNIGVSITF